MHKRDFQVTEQREILDPVRWGDAVRLALAWPIAKRSMLVTVVVGSILNLINQGDALFYGSPIELWKIGLTYCVPFCVATFGASCAIASKMSANIQVSRTPMRCR